MSIELDSIKVTPFISSRFRLDGGSMFGVVPRVLWENKAPPDTSNRIRLNSNSLVVETGGFKVLVEPGMGSKYDDKQREIYELDAMDVVSQLDCMGIAPELIDLVVPTHLHLDHVGGATVMDGSGKAGPAFPNAPVVAQRAEWEEALAVHPLTRGSYLPGDYLPLSECGLLRLVEGDSEVAPDVRVQLTGGHTPGHQVIWIGSGESEALYIGDIVPTTAHLKLNWLMAWDLEPQVVFEARERLLSDCAKNNTLVFWSHDPEIAACRLLEVKPGSFEIDPDSVIQATV